MATPQTLAKTIWIMRWASRGTVAQMRLPKLSVSVLLARVVHAPLLHHLLLLLLPHLHRHHQRVIQVVEVVPMANPQTHAKTTCCIQSKSRATVARMHLTVSSDSAVHVQDAQRAIAFNRAFAHQPQLWCDKVQGYSYLMLFCGVLLTPPNDSFAEPD